MDEAQSRVLRGLAVVLGALTALSLLAAAAGYSFFALPRFVAVFDDFNAQLPLLTIYLVDYSVPVVWAEAVLGSALLLVTAIWGGLRAHLVVHALVALALLVTAGLIVLGLALPMMRIMESL